MSEQKRTRYRIRFVVYNPKPWVAEHLLVLPRATDSPIERWVHLSEHETLQAAVINVAVQVGNDVIIPLEISTD